MWSTAIRKPYAEHDYQEAVRGAWLSVSRRLCDIARPSGKCMWNSTTTRKPYVTAWLPGCRYFVVYNCTTTRMPYATHQDNYDAVCDTPRQLRCRMRHHDNYDAVCEAKTRLSGSLWENVNKVITYASIFYIIRCLLMHRTCSNLPEDWKYILKIYIYTVSPQRKPKLRFDTCNYYKWWMNLL